MAAVAFAVALTVAASDLGDSQPLPGAKTDAPLPADLHSQILALAPAGTWGIAVTDGAQLSDCPVADQMPMSAAFFMRLRGASTAAWFFVTRADAPELARLEATCGVLYLEGGLADEAKEELARTGKRLTIEGMAAYEVTDEPLVTVVDDTTWLIGGSEASLAAMISAYRFPSQRGVAEGLRSLVDPLVGRAHYLAAVFPEDLGGLLPMKVAEVLPDPVRRAKALVLGIGVRDGFQFDALLRLRTRAEAEQALAAAIRAVEGLEDEMRLTVQTRPETKPFYDQELALLQRLELVVQDADVRAQLRLSQQEFHDMKGNWLRLPFLKLVEEPLLFPMLSRLPDE
jgi:hypothetical protein